ncbi:hypothetical protein [Rickettsia honei]|nr:hypothetical protein [Rickettsia honei]
MAKISCKNSGDVIPGFQASILSGIISRIWYNPRLHGRGIVAMYKV